MEGILETAGTACGVLIAVELIAKLCPKNQMLSFVQALVALVLLASAGAALASADWERPLGELEPAEENRELGEYINGQYEAAAQKQAEEYLKGLLGVAGLEAKKIWTEINIGEGPSIELTRVTAEFSYESDAQRAQVLLKNALGEGIAVEVKTHEN